MDDQAKYGVVVTQAGVPIDYAADYQKVLDSRWRFMEIALEVRVDIQTGTLADGYNAIVLADHNLGFLPAWEFTFESQSGNTDLSNATFLGGLMADEQKCYAHILKFNGMSTNSVSIKGYVRVYNVPMSLEYTAPNEDPTGGTGNEKSSIGVQVINGDSGGRMGDDTPSSYSLNTYSKAISVHKTGSAQANTTLTVTHNIGYLPTWYIAKLNDIVNAFYSTPLNGKRTIGPMSNFIGKSAATAQTITLSGAQSSLGTNWYAYLILKDPVEIVG